ncbi:hypothetical protein BRM22_03880 [Xanthomonas oryzae pv. oryzae]|uniref:Uncharacterized protein n=1 Tax=Xanthomonas oryzae pv. oryzae TaxID=64187 RepID=A0A854DIE7_XANOO|nr:hypothetical protein AZ54_04995 [Xanthomonas oryzae pv. oryzae PXO86]ALZ70896.1 hypothetical protein APZ20_04600 [Xanthomonas oryzae pv. oryzae]AOS03748.1 hypothetical protein ATY42_18480 [Xanthomonas oryzae pv. oryzae]AOS07101.1 hypothetical protein ATY43_14765 [Xanthomonas oryzae pv. oryzae]AOS09724.1 hypothetical protein ATY44_04640 [Xanthomonas oryzae pv. oryzae]
MTAYFFSQRSAHPASIGTLRASAWSSLHYYRRATGRTTTIACCHAKALLAARLADMRLHRRLAH